MSVRRPSARADRSAGSTIPPAAVRAGPTSRWLNRYFQRHAQVLLFSLGRLTQRPLGSFLTVAVIGITLSLPAALHVLLHNVSTLSYSWESTVQASLFLKGDVSEAQGQALADRIAGKPKVQSTHYISPAEALTEFKHLSGFGDAVTALERNPLPAVIAVRPKPSLSPAETEALVARLGQLPQVDQARMDQEWLKRLYAILHIVQRGIGVLAVLLSIAVIIIVGNTIRLDIHNQKEAIEIMKLLGASDRFIRRPFLYTGVWYGLFGGVLAWLVVSAALAVLAGPVAQLSSLYQGDFHLTGLSFGGLLTLFVAGTGLGFLGSWWAVSRHLRAIQPR